jgi:glycosyltransferase involved in cell wall biosynthesis
MSKIGLGILTYKRPDYFKECIKRIDNSKINEIVVVNDGTPYDFDVPYHLIQHAKNKGIGISKNDALKYLQSKDCDYYFLMEDDILIKDNNVFTKYIEASLETGIQHFNYSQHGLMNKKTGTEIPNPRTRIDYKNNISIDLHMHCVGAFSFYTKRCLAESGLMDDFYFNATEHLDHTYTIIKKEMHPPFWWFADIANSNQYLEDFPWSPSTSTISQGNNRNNIIAKSYDHFTKKHGHHILHTPNLSLDQVKQKLKQIYKNK